MHSRFWASTPHSFYCMVIFIKVIHSKNWRSTFYGRYNDLLLFPDLSWLWTNDIWLTDDGRLFPSLYFECFMVDTMICYTTPLSHFMCDLVLCWFVLHAPDLTSPYMTGYTFDTTAGAWPQQVKFTRPRHIFTYLDFPSVRVVLSVIFILGFVMIMD